MIIAQVHESIVHLNDDFELVLSDKELHFILMAVLGMLQEIKPRNAARVRSLVIYAVMGWVALVATGPLLQALGPAGFAWLAAGGALYSVGVVFFVLDGRVRHFHGIWHLFVIAGSLAHYVAVLGYVVP